MRNPLCDVGVSLRRLFPESVMLYAADARARSCTSNHLQVRPGDVYVALDAADADGHDFVPEAIARGAETVVVERAVPQTRVPMCLVPDTRVAFGTLCQALAGDPCDSLSCIGVTGTDGKTTTARLIGSVLREAGAAVGVLDDLSREGAPQQPLPAAVSSSPEVAAALGEMTANQATHAVLEISSRALAEQVLSGTKLDAACFTNLTQAHLDLHNSAAKYRHVKTRLLHHLREDRVCVLNRDDPMSARLASFAPGPVLTYGLCGTSDHADVTAEILERNPAEQSFLLMFESDTIVVRTRPIGDHHVLNCLAAAAVGIALGIDLATVVRGIERVESVPGRLERVGCSPGPRAYVDTSSTPTALAAALEALRGTSGRVWCISDLPRTADDDELARFGKVLAKMADTPTIAPAEPCEDFTWIRCGQLQTGLERGQVLQFRDDREAAIVEALAAAGEEDSVLVVGSSGAARDRAIVEQGLRSRARRAIPAPPA